MNKRLWFAAALLVVGFSLAVHAATNAPPREPSPPAKATDTSTPGVKAAEALTTITGVAISPLLGVSAVGAWKYLNTPQAKRGRLPWFAQPWFWIPALVLVGIVFAKDVMGPALPTALKKPFDVAEVFENKLSALVVAGAFVPIIVSIFGSVPGDESRLSGLGLAMADPALLLNYAAVPIGIAVFLVVWMVAHVINVLILVSPFATVDAALKALRLFLLGTVTMTGFANAYAGAALSILIIVVAYFLAGWSFRLSVFGTVFAWDLLTMRQRRFTPKPSGNPVFTARKFERVPVRTYGKLVREETDRLVLKYRPLPFTRERTLTLPEGKYLVGRGLIYSEMMMVEGEVAKTMLTLPPRFRTHEEELVSLYALAGVQDTGMVKGCKTVWRWLKELFGFGTAPAPEPTGTG